MDMRAGALVLELQRRWTGFRWADVAELREIALTSSPAAWPPTILVRLQVGDVGVIWEDPYDVDALRDAPLEGAASLWLGLVEASMCEAGYL